MANETKDLQKPRVKRPTSSEEEITYLIEKGWEYEEDGDINNPNVRWYYPGEDRKEKKEMVAQTYKQEIRDERGHITGFRDAPISSKDADGNMVQTQQLLLTIPGRTRSQAVKMQMVWDTKGKN